MAASRTWLGISPPPEALPDRFAPDAHHRPVLLPLRALWRLQRAEAVRHHLRAGGAFRRRRPLRRALRPDRREPPLAGRPLPGAAGSAGRGDVRAGSGRWCSGWAASALLWPVLDANYRGLPPGSARIVSIARPAGAVRRSMAAALILLYRWVAPRPVATTAPTRYCRWASRWRGERWWPGPPGWRWRPGRARCYATSTRGPPSPTTVWPIADPACSRSRRTTSSTR